MLRGIDVSHHNPNPDFNQAKAAGVSFVYIKATEGVSFRDPQCQPNALNAMRAGLHIGFYHFARPGIDQPEDEAKNFVEAISIFKYDLIPVLDLEVNQKDLSGEELHQWARKFIDAVKSKTGHNVMLYTDLYFWNQYPELQKLNDVPLWVAAYRQTAPAVSWTVWQYTDKESIPGVGTCDANYIADLTKILIAPPEPKPAQPAKPTKPSQPVKPVVNLPNVVLKPGDHGPAVKAVQEALNKLNFKCGEADGIYGPKTADAVLRFQKMYGIKPFDGIYGPKTREKMLELLKG